MPVPIQRELRELLGGGGDLSTPNRDLFHSVDDLLGRRPLLLGRYLDAGTCLGDLLHHGQAVLHLADTLVHCN